MLGKILKDKRHALEKTQSEVAALIGISKRAYETYEQNYRTPRPDTIKRIAEFFDCSIDELFKKEA